MLVVPSALTLVLLFTFFIWLYKEEKRRKQQRQQREEEWKKEIQTFRECCKKAVESDTP